MEDEPEPIQHARKMEAIGRFASSVAHDFNNVLTAILGNATLLERRLAAQGISRRELGEIRNAVDKATLLTRQLLAFAKRSPEEPRAVDLAGLVHDVEPLLRPLIGDDIEFVVRAGDPGAVVLADSTQLEQVILNLVVNARDAMPRGGRLELAIERLALGAERAGAQGIAEGPYVGLVVRDTGVGMDDDVRTRIFEPFFTTKPGGKGSGLGLTTVYAVARHGGGDVEVSSAPGLGSTFRVLLPRATVAPAAAPDSPGVEAAPAGGSETVLLVEDEELLSRLATDVLGALGYRVLAARSGDEAVRIATEHVGGIDLLLTDVVMPGMGGRELAERLTGSRADLRVLYMSGYNEDETLRLAIQERAVAFLAKPFRPEQLAVKVREALGGAPASPPSP